MPREYPTFFDDEAPENCVECDVGLPETNDTGFCSKTCEDRYCYASDVDTDKFFEDLKLELAMAEHFHANKQKYLH
jgi:hypothetical protein